MLTHPAPGMPAGCSQRRLRTADLHDLERGERYKAGCDSSCDAGEAATHAAMIVRWPHLPAVKSATACRPRREQRERQQDARATSPLVTFGFIIILTTHCFAQLLHNLVHPRATPLATVSHTSSGSGAVTVAKQNSLSPAFTLQYMAVKIYCWFLFISSVMYDCVATHC